MLPSGIEPPTSPLPRVCSTTELRQQDQTREAKRSTRVNGAAIATAWRQAQAANSNFAWIGTQGPFGSARIRLILSHERQDRNRPAEPQTGDRGPGETAPRTRRRKTQGKSFETQTAGARPPFGPGRRNKWTACRKNGRIVMFRPRSIEASRKIP